MLDRLNSMFRSDALTSTLSVFPELNEQRLAAELRLTEQGQERGEKNLPAANSKEFDHIETSIINKTEELRRTGLENFEQNRRVYSERLARAGEAKKEVDIVAGRAKNEFGTSVQSWKTAMTPTVERLRECYQWRSDFRERNRLRRPANHFEGWIRFGSLAIIMIIVEAAMNSFMFAQGNEAGLLGGLLTAFIFSGLNVVVSILLGGFTRYVNHRNIAKKIFGLGSFLVWTVFAVALNRMIANFRDLIDEGTSWAAALQEAVPSMLEDPVGLNSIDSWILFGIGGVISILSYMKGLNVADPYPGYAKVDRALEMARDQHDAEVNHALEELTERRDEAIEELRDADQKVRDGITEAIDALFGQSALNAHLSSFLNQCDLKATHLLAIYRDANIAARSEPTPPSFEKAHKFDTFKPKEIEVSRRKNAESESEKVTETINRTIAEIFDQFESARKEFMLPEQIERGDHLPARVDSITPIDVQTD